MIENFLPSPIHSRIFIVSTSENQRRDPDFESQDKTADLKPDAGELSLELRDARLRGHPLGEATET